MECSKCGKSISEEELHVCEGGKELFTDSYGSMSFQVPETEKYRCPRCGYIAVVSPEGSFIVGQSHYGSISILIPGFEGQYCERCFAEWLSKNIPKMERTDGNSESV